jgi:rare lipoprotein A
MIYKNLLLTLLIILLSGCSVSNLNPFSHRNQIYYIEGEDIEPDRTIRSGHTPIRNPDGGYTSKARQKSTMKTYVVKGRVYHPTYVGVGDTMTGVASWYGPNFHGLQTSNGEQYNMYSKTVAHKTWPMDTMVKITNLDNGKSTIARINDRGPFVAGRVVDCSYAVGKEIGIDKKGTCNVKLEVVGFAGKVYKPEAGKVAPKVKLTNFGVQVGAFAQEENAKRAKAKYAALAGDGKSVVIKVGKDKDGRILNRVHVMGFGSKEEALDFIRDNSIEGGFVIRN